MIENVYLLDGSIFGGGLWLVRTLATTLNIAADFDRVVMAALMTAGPSETFFDQYTTILMLLRTSPIDKLKVLSISAQEIFNERELKCKRLTPYNETLDSNFILQTPLQLNQTVGTLSNQFLFSPFQSDWGISIQWQQYAISNMLGPLATGIATTPILFVKSECFMSFGTNFEAMNNSVGEIQAKGCFGEWIGWQSSGITGNKGSLEIPLNGKDVYLFLGSKALEANFLIGAVIVVYNGFRRVWLFTIVVIGVIHCLLFLAGAPWFLVQRCFGRKNRTTDKLWSLGFMTNILFGAATATTIVALIYRPFRYIGLGVSFGFLILVGIVDLFQGCRTIWFKVSSYAFTLTSIATLILIYFREVPLWVHAIFYVTFLVSYFIRIGSLIQFSIVCHKELVLSSNSIQRHVTTDESKM